MKPTLCLIALFAFLTGLAFTLGFFWEGISYLCTTGALWLFHIANREREEAIQIAQNLEKRLREIIRSNNTPRH